ncbi:hypothetical protein [Sideroxydans lithotrophicus]|uniref:Outer membrane protein beta-barrel domain-containing protein n=1 Tax=Sideroxydans lithotrophicus (strain ES-1) TaxID=580332 RepID=D5CUH4_SIDLE|nr:hypothetical protein [Sideroxydans lithotrophicus]ADE12361.1 conserved hypothetical protein [Sideroxydans lithotrophicus ES-1]
MKKLLVLLCTLGIAQPVMAANITTLGSLVQPEFRTLSEDLGAALSYKPITPAAPLGTTGFDMGIEVTQTDMSRSSQLWSKITNGGSTISKLYIPKLHIAKGLPFGIDIAAFYSKIPSTNISLYGGELRYAILDGGLAQPAVAIRGSFTKLSGVNQLSLDTKGLDVSISKGFAMFTPYAGLGQVWVNSTPNVAGLVAESFTQGKVFLGANLNLGFSNLAAEFDKTGGVQSVSMKLGFRF